MPLSVESAPDAQSPQPASMPLPLPQQQAASGDDSDTKMSDAPAIPVAFQDIYSKNKGVIISGSPGIGKSIFGLILVALLQKQATPIPVFYQRLAAKQPSILFHNHAVIFAPPDEDIPPNAVYIIDPTRNADLQPVPNHYCIVLASPRGDRFGDFQKHSQIKYGALCLQLISSVC